MWIEAETNGRATLGQRVAAATPARRHSGGAVGVTSQGRRRGFGGTIGGRGPAGLKPATSRPPVWKRPEEPTAPQRLMTCPPNVLHRILHQISQQQPDLVTVVQSWDRLPPAIRHGILAMVEACLGRGNPTAGTGSDAPSPEREGGIT